MPLNSESNIALIYQPGNCLQEAILVLLSDFLSKKYTPFNRIFQGKKGRTSKRGDEKLSMPPIALNKSTFFSYWGGSNSTGDKDPGKSLNSSILHTWKNHKKRNGFLKIYRWPMCPLWRIWHVGVLRICCLMFQFRLCCGAQGSNS